MSKRRMPKADIGSQMGSVYERIFHSARDGVVVIQDGKIAIANPSFSALTQYNESDLLGMSFAELCDESSTTERRVEDKSNSTFRINIIARTSKTVPVDIALTKFEYEQKPALLAIVRDASFQIDLERIAQASESKYRNLFDSSPMAYFSLSPHGIIQQVNNAAAELLGYPIEDLVRRSISSLFPQNGTFSDSGKVLISEIMQGKEIKDLEVQMVDSEGKRIWVSITASLLKNPGIINAIGLMAVNIDRRKLAEARAFANQERAALILEVMTHDLNNVNQSLLFSLGLIDVLPDLSQPGKNLVQQTIDEVKRSARMISNLRSIFDMGDSPLESEAMDLAPIVQQALHMVEEEMPSKRILLGMDFQKGDMIIEGHPKLQTVFFNMLLNSAQFDSKNEVVINLSSKKTKSGEKIRLEIEDFGRGIPDSLKEYIFRRSGHPDAQIVGRGLGLTLVDRIISSLGGEIWVEDRVEGDYSQGARFILMMRLWNERKILECGRLSCVSFYRSEHCLFCEPTFEILQGVMDELSIPVSLLEVVNVDDPLAGIRESDLPMLPFTKICNHEIVGFADIDDVRVALMNLLMHPCYPY
ncbi:MAG: PAS domain-containing protein [Candidatus Thorarchaeota archaeon]